MSSDPLVAGGPPLPMPRTTLVGRRTEVAAARALLLDEAAPLVTLTGPGGVGKTRLALAIAHDVAGGFCDGAVFVDLAPVRDPTLVVAAIAAAVGVREGGDRPLSEVLRSVLKPAQALLLLDNCEHVLDAAPEIASLLSACPALQILATSRAPLRVRGEHLLPTPPLPTPRDASRLATASLAEIEAVALFVARGREVDPAFAVTDANALVVADIVRRLDGLPLAIELAAARLRALSPAAMAALLDDRLRLLTGGPRDVAARQQTLRDTIAWSYALLDPAEQALFRRLAVFAGGFDLAAAAAVAGGDRPAVVDGLIVLVDQSLLGRTVISGGADRFGILETIREFGLRELRAAGEEVATRDRHALWCLDLVEAAWPPRSPALPNDDALARLDTERDNERAALDWAIERGDGTVALRLVGALAEHWLLRGSFSEGRSWTERALRLDVELPRLRSSALWGAGGMAMFQGDYVVASTLLDECLALADAHGDSIDVLRARFFLGQLANDLCDSTRALAHTEAAVALARESGDDGWLPYTVNQLGDEIHRRGDNRRAAGLHEEAIRLAKANGDRYGEMLAVDGLAFDLHALGELSRAELLYRRVTDLGRAIDNPWGVAQGVMGLASVASSRGEADAAVRLLAAAEVLTMPIGFRFGSEYLTGRDNALARARAQLGAARVAEIWEVVRAMPGDQAVAHALSDEHEASSVSPGAAASIPGSPPDGCFALSAREREIIGLLAQRRTDKEIAEALFISPRTVMSHATNIFTKLGVANRREAAAVAAKHGLV